jgi:hypothetical protein
MQKKRISKETIRDYIYDDVAAFDSPQKTQGSQ